MHKFVCLNFPNSELVARMCGIYSENIGKTLIFIYLSYA